MRVMGKGLGTCLKWNGRLSTKTVFDMMFIIICTVIHKVNQPVPPRANCSKGGCPKTQAGQADFLTRIQGSRGPDGGPDEDRPTGRQVKDDLRKFCLFRRNGEFPLPANCDFFIYCSHGEGSFSPCPLGTKFNPVFLTCDHLVNHECRFEGRK